MGRITVTLPWPHKDLHSNSRAHHMAKHRAIAKARWTAQFMAEQAGVGCWPDATILIEYYPPSRRGDPQNVPTALKAYIDGIADAMGCDDRALKVDFPSVFAGTRKPADVVFHIIPPVVEIPLRGQVG